MGLNYRQLRNLTARRIIGALLKDGFFLDRQVGSHRRYHHPDNRRATVTFHSSSETFTPKTLKSMLEEQAKWTKDDLKRLGLV
ncbi:MAG TPA: type II toxin-antitoxin system HicA family toxin [Candidatus Paceibacterota bacterium]